MTGLVEGISEKQSELNNLINHFYAEVWNTKKIWIGLGMLTFTILDDMTTIENQITRAGKQLNRLGKKL